MLQETVSNRWHIHIFHTANLIICHVTNFKKSFSKKKALIGIIILLDLKEVRAV